MKIFIKYAVCLLFCVSLQLNSAFVALACGPSSIEPVFKYDHAPENPYENFAAGKLGLIKPSQRRVVLFAAYRYLIGGGFSADEQKDLIAVWNAEFNNESYTDDDVKEAVLAWVSERKKIFPKEEKPPEIYTERSYGGYEFFPNCTRNAFETAKETLSDRILRYGSDNKDVRDWTLAQDKVFTNCAAGRQIPEMADNSMPEWLQKDREYQLAAADFYSMHYDEAKNRFALIAVDSDSPWHELAQYLVGRTLIRQASAAKEESLKNVYYAEAEQHLQISASGGKYSESAERLIGLVKFRLRPEERVNELARELSGQSQNHELRQNLIDYSWLLDKFEKEGLEAEENRRKSRDPNNENNSNSTDIPADEKDDGKIAIYFGNEDYSKSWTIKVSPEATDDEAVAEAERIAGPLTEKMKQSIREGRRDAYASRFSQNLGSEYPGGYWGEVESSRAFLPQFLLQSDLTDWLFTFQMKSADSYQHSLERFRESRSDLWLMTAISKAGPGSADLDYIIESAKRTNVNSPAFPTIAYHQARILIEQNKPAEARKLIDDLLRSSVSLTISARNEFMELRAKLVETLDEYLKYSQLKPFAFYNEGASSTLAALMEVAKTYYDPEYNKGSREDFEREIEESYKDLLPWDSRVMFNYSTIESINKFFSLPLLVEAKNSRELPDYLKNRFLMAAFTRALILNDQQTTQMLYPEVVALHPEFEKGIFSINAARTAASRQEAILYFLLKNPILTPFVEAGLGKDDNEANTWDADDWWCQPYDSEDESDEYAPKRPAFLSKSQETASKIERQKLIDLGDGPNYLGRSVLAWQKRSPQDKRIPESLFIVYEANGWTKYGCGNNEEIRNAARDLLLKRYPKSEFANLIIKEQAETN